MPVTINGSSGITAADGVSVFTNSQGNVGIGTSSPVARLNVSVADGGGVVISNTNDTHTGALSFGDTSANSSGRISYDHSSNALRFDTNGSERARITAAGEFLVGKTGATINSAGQELGSYAGFTRSGDVPVFVQRLTNTGDLIQFRYNASAVVGSISTNGTGVTYGTSSDYRLKENIAPMTGALARVAALKPCTYTWKSDGSAGEGFIAHELQQVCPDAVSGEKDAVNEDGSIKPQSIDTSFLVATLTAAIQELKAELDTAKARIAALEGAQA